MAIIFPFDISIFSRFWYDGLNLLSTIQPSSSAMLWTFNTFLFLMDCQQLPSTHMILRCAKSIFSFERLECSASSSFIRTPLKLVYQSVTVITVTILLFYFQAARKSFSPWSLKYQNVTKTTEAREVMVEMPLNFDSKNQNSYGVLQLVPPGCDTENFLNHVGTWQVSQ